jgi:hypothetical protein
LEYAIQRLILKRMGFGWHFSMRSGQKTRKNIAPTDGELCGAIQFVENSQVNKPEALATESGNRWKFNRWRFVFARPWLTCV